MTTENPSLIKLEGVTKVFLTDEVETHALSGVHLRIERNRLMLVDCTQFRIVREEAEARAPAAADPPVDGESEPDAGSGPGLRSVDEVAAMMGLPVNTVKTHLHRARAALRAAWAREEEGSR